jgi:hypothetical protein
MKLGNGTKPNIVDTNDEESMELSDEPETNVVDNTDDERCMEITNDDGIDVAPKPRNVPKGLDSKLKQKKTWTKLKSGLNGWKTLPAKNAQKYQMQQNLNIHLQKLSVILSRTLVNFSIGNSQPGVGVVIGSWGCTVR